MITPDDKPMYLAAVLVTIVIVLAVAIAIAQVVQSLHLG